MRVAMFLKTLFLLTTAILVSCSPPPLKITPVEETEMLSSESRYSDEKFKNMKSSREYFYVKTENCTGEIEEHVNYYNQWKKDAFMDIEIEDGEIRISRPRKTASLNVGLKGQWDHTNSQLTDISGQFGIATEEDWSRASGFLYISDEHIMGSIHGGHIRYDRFSPPLDTNVDISCSVSIIIEKKKD